MRRMLLLLLIGLVPVVAHGADRLRLGVPGHRCGSTGDAETERPAENSDGQHEVLHCQTDRRFVQSAGLVSRPASAHAAGCRSRHLNIRLRLLPSADRHRPR